MRTFEAAARHLSFKQAAAELNVTPAAVSQQIKALEELLGVPLFQRLTRSLKLSEHGAVMLPGVREGLTCLASAVLSVRGHDGARLLLVTAPPSLANHWLIPRLPAFYDDHPAIEVRLSSSSDLVDRGSDAAALAALESAPGDPHCRLVIVYGSGGPAGHRVDALLTPDYVPVCAPTLATPEAPLREPADLLRQALIHDDTLAKPQGTGRRTWGWADWLRAAGVHGRISGTGRRFSNAVLAINAAVAGQGVALAARPLVASHIAAGSLVVPFERAIRSPYTYHLVTREDVAPQPAVTAFRQWLLAQARSGGG